MTEVLASLYGLISEYGLIALSVLLIGAAIFIGPIRRLILSILSLIPAALLTILSALAVFIWKPVLGTVNRLPGLKAVPTFMAGFLEKVGQSSDDLLQQGEREKFARQVWPEDRYPWLYRAVPKDIRRPLWEDGRLPGGFELSWLADRHLSASLFKDAAKAGLAAAILLALVAFALFLLPSGSAAFAPLGQSFDAQPPVIEEWPDGSTVSVNRLSLIAQGLGLSIVSLFSTLWRSSAFLLAWLPLMFGTSILMMLVVIERHRREAAAPYEISSKDALVRWPYRAEMRAIANSTYARQVELSEGYLKDTPLFDLGKATGTLKLRGDLNAPLADQQLALDRDSLFQHVMVMGGTGEGKTTAVLKPLLRQMLAQESFGLYVCDAKGVLWNDALAIARKAGRSADAIRIIGTGDDQYGVDVFSSLTPTQIASVLRSVLTQLSAGERGDSFWPDMAATLTRHMLTIGQAYAQTDQGKALLASSAPDRVNPYSLWWAYQALLDEKKLQEALDQISAIIDGLAEDDAEPADKEAYGVLTSSEVTASRSYLSGAWADMAEKTRSGIIANVSQLLDGFSGAPELRKRFVSGLPENTIPISDALEGKVVLSALSNIEDGLPARLVNILLKTCLYREARTREARMKAEGSGSPQEKPCIVMMDEVQELVTVDPASGLSDASFWNVARSTGLVGVFATQTVAALDQAMGEVAAKNFLQQARTKIFLRSEDRATVDYACWCAGQFERNRVFENDQKESIDHRFMVDGWDPFASVEDEARIDIDRGGLLILRTARMLISMNRNQIGEARTERAYKPDMRFVPVQSFGMDNSQRFSVNMARLQALQAAHWRAEDLERKFRAEGNQMSPALAPADMIGMGRWHAYALVQRAGAMRQDIIRLEHDYE